MSYRKTAVALAVILAAQAGSAFADKGGAAHTMWTSSEVPDSTLEYSYEAGDKYGWRAVLYVGSGSETNASGTVNNLHVTSNALVSTGKAQDEPVYGVIVMSDTTDVTFAGDTFTSVVNTDFKGLGGNQATALCVNDGKVSVTADSVVLKSTSAADIGKSAYGLVSWSDEGVTISGKTLNVEVKTNTIRTDPGHYSDAAGLAVYAGETSVTTTEGAKITVTSTADETAAATTGQYAGAGNFTGAGIVYGAVAGGGSLTLLGTSDINVTSVAAHASGITVRNFYKNSTEGEQFKNSALTLDTSTIRVHSQSGNAFGLDAELVEGTDTYDVVADVKGGLTVHAVSDEAAAYGVRLSGKATIALKGNLDITAQGKESFALYTDQGNLAVSGNTAVLKGNVRAANGGTITFGNPESIGMRTARAAAEANTASVTEVVLEGNMTSTSDSTITFHTTNVTLGAGNIINLEGTTQAANSQILVQALPEGDKPVISVKSLAAKSTLGVRAAGSLNDSLKGDINAFAKTLAITGDGVAGTEIVLEEGMYEGAASAELASDGTIDTTTVTKPAASSVMTDSLTIATAAQLSLNRILMNDVRKRMGDLRSASEASGVWARYDGGKLSGSEGLENQFNTIQIGADTAWGSEVRTGVAASYTTGDTDYSRGSADTDTYSFAAYGTWMADNGFFADVVARYASADTDMTVDGNKTGSLKNAVFGLSAETGWRFDLTDTAYIEPQLEAAYTYVESDNLTLGNAAYDFDSVESVIGRAGFAAGIQCPNNFGSVYVRASVVHEFMGDAKVTGANGSTYSIDGKDTWFEYGIGANFNISRNVYAWADIERTAGAVLDEDWRGTVGVRYMW